MFVSISSKKLRYCLYILCFFLIGMNFRRQWGSFSQLSTQLHRYAHMEDLVEPTHPWVQAHCKELNSMQDIENLIDATVRYKTDYDNWGMKDYYPTVSEIIEKGEEDCDGIAILFASFVVAKGYAAPSEVGLVLGFGHVWVRVKGKYYLEEGVTPRLIRTLDHKWIQP